jgi:hypothetical protein
MKTDYELVKALTAMYKFLGGDSCMGCSCEKSKEHHFNCSVLSDNKLLLDAIIKASTTCGKRVTCVYRGSIINIEVIF